MIARSGTYSVRSRVIDDDKNVYGPSLPLSSPSSLSLETDLSLALVVDLEWQFKLAKDW
jgi:hypothetical protein